jgi:ABC-type transport system involved in multi-copper enzyme maturation permease subunit
MLTHEFRYCLWQAMVVPAALVVAFSSYLLDSTVFHAGFGLLFYISNFVGLALLALAFRMALTVFGREDRDGALEYLLSLPVGRWKLFLCKTATR